MDSILLEVRALGRNKHLLTDNLKLGGCPPDNGFTLKEIMCTDFHLILWKIFRNPDLTAKMLTTTRRKGIKVKRGTLF